MLSPAKISPSDLIIQSAKELARRKKKEVIQARTRAKLERHWRELEAMDIGFKYDRSGNYEDHIGPHTVMFFTFGDSARGSVGIDNAKVTLHNLRVITLRKNKHWVDEVIEAVKAEADARRPTLKTQQHGHLLAGAAK